MRVFSGLLTSLQDNPLELFFVAAAPRLDKPTCNKQGDNKEKMSFTLWLALLSKMIADPYCRKKPMKNMANPRDVAESA
jgi:hypothetical protein